MNILIACSDVVMSGLLRHALHRTAARVDVALSQELIVQQIMVCDYDVIISLFAAPFLNGGEMILNIRKNNRPKTHIISWIQNEQTVISLYENGINQYFTLPINLHRLTTKIQDNIL